MVKWILILMIIFLITSCWEKQEKQNKWIIDDSLDIIINYYNRLDWNVREARKVKKIIKWNQRRLDKELKNIK
jgi:hypothetical protein